MKNIPFNFMLKGIYMLLKSPQLKETLNLNSVNPAEAVDYINKYIDEKSCEFMSIDLSSMNVLDACYITTLCSTKHYIKYPNGKIEWKVSSDAVKEFNKDLELGNNSYIL